MLTASGNHIARADDIGGFVFRSRAPDAGLGGDVHHRIAAGDRTTDSVGVGETALNLLDAGIECRMRAARE